MFIFGKKKVRREDKIWNIKDVHEFVSEAIELLFKKTNYGSNLDELTREEKNFYFVNELEMEVNNGGFSQYFYNTSGDNANEVMGALEEMKFVNTIKLYEKVLEVFDNNIPRDRDERQELLTNYVDEKLDLLDNEFYKYLDNFEELYYNYINENKDKFF
jgi:hypothetical protein